VRCPVVIVAVRARLASPSTAGWTGRDYLEDRLTAADLLTCPPLVCACRPSMAGPGWEAPNERRAPGLWSADAGSDAASAS
jgi:hypothetical protein